MKNGVNCFHRIDREWLSKEQFYKVEGLEGDLITTETYEEGDKIEVNISRVLQLPLEDKDRFLIFRYGEEDSKKEVSLCSHLKKKIPDYQEKKCDISYIIVDHEEEKTYLVCGEIKKTLKIDTLDKARKQLISTYIDLSFINSLLTMNIYKLEPIFFVVTNEVKITRHVANTQALLYGKSNIPYNILMKEYFDNVFYYSLNIPTFIKKCDSDVSLLDSWASKDIGFYVV